MSIKPEDVESVGGVNVAYAAKGLLDKYREQNGLNPVAIAGAGPGGGSAYASGAGSVAIGGNGGASGYRSEPWPRYDWSKLDAGWAFERGKLVTHDPVDGLSSWTPSWLEETFAEETCSHLLTQARAQLAKCRMNGSSAWSTPTGDEIVSDMKVEAQRVGGVDLTTGIYRHCGVQPGDTWVERLERVNALVDGYREQLLKRRRFSAIQSVGRAIRHAIESECNVRAMVTTAFPEGNVVEVLYPNPNEYPDLHERVRGTALTYTPPGIELRVERQDKVFRQ